MGINSAATDKVSFDIDVPLGHMNWAVGGAMSGGSGYVKGAIKDAWAAASKEIELEKTESLKLSLMMGNWNFARIFSKVFQQHVMQNSSIELYEFGSALPKKEIKNYSRYTDKKLDAMVDIHIREFGLQSQENGFAVTVETVIDVVNLRTFKKIASAAMIYNYKYARKMQDSYYEEYIQEEMLQGKVPTRYVMSGGKQKPDIPYYKSILPPDSVIYCPIAVASYENYLMDDEAIFKKELEKAAVVMSRNFVVKLGFVDAVNFSWKDQYLRRP
jgi:hypothetical protein